MGPTIGFLHFECARWLTHPRGRVWSPPHHDVDLFFKSSTLQTQYHEEVESWIGVRSLRVSKEVKGRWVDRGWGGLWWVKREDHLKIHFLSHRGDLPRLKRRVVEWMPSIPRFVGARVWCWLWSVDLEKHSTTTPTSCTTKVCMCCSVTCFSLFLLLSIFYRPYLWFKICSWNIFFNNF